MKLARIIKQLSGLAVLSGLPTSLVYAHPGHETATGLFHGVLHSEHLLVLLAISAVAIIGKIIKDRY